MDDEAKNRWFAEEIARTITQQQQLAAERQRARPDGAPEPQVVHKTTSDGLIQPVQQQQPVSPTVGWKSWVIAAADRAVAGYAAAAEEAIAQFVVSRERVLIKRIATLESRARCAGKSSGAGAVSLVSGAPRRKGQREG